MKLHPEGRVRILLEEVEVDVDPAGSTVELKIDGTWYPAEWQGSAVHTPSVGDTPERWTQDARTTGYFAGPDMATPAGATVLTDSPTHRHLTRIRVTKDGQVLVNYSDPIDVQE